MAEINFFQEETDFILQDQDLVTGWLQKLAEKENKEISFLNYIFCSDEYLHQVNLQYLGHDTLTDIITFPYEESSLLEADIFISVDRVRENAVSYNTSFNKELYRVMAHGLLHLCGYGDKTPSEKEMMRAKEEECLSCIIRS